MTRPPNEDDDEERLQRSTNTTTKETEANNEEGAKGQTFRKRRLSLTLQKDSRPLKQAGTGVNNDDDEDDDDDHDHNEDDEADDTQSHTLHIHASEDHCSTTANSSNGLHAESNHSRDDDEEEEEEDEKAHTFRKRRLSLTTTNQTTTTTCGPNHSSPGKFRRSSMDSHSSFASSVGSSHDDTSSHHHHHHTTNTSSSHAWISRTLHAGELIGTDGTLPPSPAHGPSFSTHFLYQTANTNNNTLPPLLLQPPVPPVLELGTTAAATNPPSSSQKNRHHHNEDGEEDRAAAGRDHHHTNNNNNNNTTTTTTRIPKWKRRHTFDARRDNPDHKLPFHPDVVGTYSCHGVEPVYSSLDNNDDEDDHDDGRNNNNNYHIPAMVPVTVAKINQDRGGVVCPYRNHPRTALFAVYDGHGHGGELVSQFALYEIQRRLEKHPLFDSDIERAMKETFLAVDDALTDEPSIDPMFAGTTACVVLLQNQRLTIANAGDSRAVCGRRKSPTTNHHSNHHHNNEVLLLSTAVKTAALFPYVAIDLSHDQNPDVPAEMARIQAAGGYVSLPPGPGLSARVWLDPRCTQIGLAMSRSIGDHAISTVGVIAEPEVTYHDITEEDEFFIVASDGVWEFLDSTEAVNIVGNNLHRGSTKACQALIEAASARWYEEEGAYRDDITAIVVRLTELWKKVENGKLMR